MPDLVNQMFCETHQCRISITGCMLRQQRNQESPPAWMYNKIPGDPKCKDCAQGKVIMKKYKHKKEALMAADTDSRFRQTQQDLEELEMAARKRTGAGADETASTEKQDTVMASKTCSDVDCELTCYMGEADHYFYRSKNTKDGFEGVCKQCKTKKARERRQAKKAARPAKPARSKKSKPKKNPEKAAAAPPEAPVAEVVTADAAPVTDTIKKNDHPVDLDKMVKKIFEQAGHPSVYEALEKRAHLEFRTPALQAIAMISEACD